MPRPHTNPIGVPATGWDGDPSTMFDELLDAAVESPTSREIAASRAGLSAVGARATERGPAHPEFSDGQDSRISSSRE